MSKIDPPINEFEYWKYKRYLLLAVGTIIMTLISIPYAWSVFNAPIAKEFSDVGQATLQFAFTVFMISYGAFGIVGGYLVSFFKTIKINLLISAVLIFLSFMISSLATEVWHFYIGFGILGGAGVVVAYNAVVVSLTKWFSDRLGVATGILMMGYGLGSFIIGFVYSLLLENGIGWRICFFCFGIVIALVCILGALFISFPAKEYKPPIRIVKLEKKCWETVELPPRKMISRPTFWFLYLMGMGSIMASMGIISNGRNLVLAVNPTALGSEVAIIVGILSITNACGRVFTGFLNDIAGTSKNIKISAFCVFISTLLVALAVMLHSYVFLIIAFICLGFSAGMSVPDAAVVTRKLYGETHYQVNFQLVMSGSIFHGFIATLVGGLYDISGSYVAPMFILAGLGLIGFIFSLLIKKA